MHFTGCTKTHAAVLAIWPKRPGPALCCTGAWVGATGVRCAALGYAAVLADRVCCGAAARAGAAVGREPPAEPRPDRGMMDCVFEVMDV